MKTLLVPLDGSPLAEQALPYARALAPALGAQIHLLRVVSDPQKDPDRHLLEPLTALYSAGEPLALELEHERQSWERRRQNAENYLGYQADLLIRDGFSVSTETCIGPPDEVIAETANACGATMIVMATHGYGGLRRWALGSVADRVAQTADCPLLLVRGEAPPGKIEIRRILMPTDGSDLAFQALPLASELATCCHAELVLLRALQSPAELYASARSPHFYESLDTLHDLILTEMRETADDLARRDIVAVPAVVAGMPAESIVDEAEMRGADLIVMATHGYSGMRRWALGSIADKVLHATKKPLVLVRAKATEPTSKADARQ